MFFLKCGLKHLDNLFSMYTMFFQHWIFHISNLKLKYTTIFLIVNIFLQTSWSSTKPCCSYQSNHSLPLLTAAQSQTRTPHTLSLLIAVRLGRHHCPLPWLPPFRLPPGLVFHQRLHCSVMNPATHGLSHHHGRIRPYAHAHIRGMVVLMPPGQTSWPWRHQRTLNSIVGPATHWPIHHHSRLWPPAHARGMATLGLRCHHCH